MTRSVAIAMCTYNGLEFVLGQLGSIAGQTRRPDQLVVFDDASTDGTPDLIREFATSCGFAVELVVNETNHGVTKNFEAAIEHCRGDVIFLADQDDVWQSDKIARMLDAFDRDPECGFAFSNASLVDRAGADTGTTLWQVSGLVDSEWQALSGEQQLVALLSGASLVYGNTLAFRAAWRDAILPIDTATRYMTHDTWIALVLSALGARGVAIDENLVRYRQHSAQTSGGMISKNPLAYHVTHHMHSRSDEFLELSHVFDNILRRLRSREAWERASKETQSLISAKRDHLQVRASMAQHGLLPRIRLAVSELLSGRYSRFSSSYKSALKDIVLG